MNLCHPFSILFYKTKKGGHRPPLQNIILYNNYQLLILQKSLQ